MNRVEFILERYEKYSDGSWRLNETERIGERGICLSLKNGKFFYDGKEIFINTDPNHPTCGAYFKVAKITKQEDYAITDKILCEFTAYYLAPIEYVIGVLIYKHSMPVYFCHPKRKPSKYSGFDVNECLFDEDIMQLRKKMIRKFKGNMHFNEANRRCYAEFI